VLYKIGEIAAKINRIEIDSSHRYISSRGLWNEYIAKRLRERLEPLIHNEIITRDEIEQIAKIMLSITVKQSLSFLHLDMRRVNMIYDKGNIYVLDAENSEFGDPLFEIAVIDVGNELEPDLMKGYKSVSGDSFELEGELYNLYKMERQALVTHIFLNIVKNEPQLTELYLRKFYEVKNKLLSWKAAK
jgi:fructosamine-3-kinase